MIWLISGYQLSTLKIKLPTLKIKADSFDKALEIARTIDPGYNTGQPL